MCQNIFEYQSLKLFQSETETSRTIYMNRNSTLPNTFFLRLPTRNLNKTVTIRPIVIFKLTFILNYYHSKTYFDY